VITIGIDPSINCTGVCVYDSATKAHKYYMIVGKMTKKMTSFKHDNISILNYSKEDTNKGEYQDKEYMKSLNIKRICSLIETILDLFNPDLVQMEGVSYGSLGSAALVDLAGLNFALRMILINKNIRFNVLAPTSVKKFAVGNGGAEKDVMVASWKKLDRQMNDISDIKVDDLADSYFMAHYNI
jgi:Holliday junction resolvasome RuvABC endonuclease subunit